MITGSRSGGGCITRGMPLMALGTWATWKKKQLWEQMWHSDDDDDDEEEVTIGGR